MGLKLERDKDEQWEIGCHAIEGTVEAMRDNLRDRGVEDGDAMESFAADERGKMQEELGRNIEGDFSSPYEMPDFDAVADSLLETAGELQEESGSEGEILEGLTETEITDICAGLAGDEGDLQ